MVVSGRNQFIAKESDSEFKPIMRWVNFKYQPSGQKEEIKKAFYDILSAKGMWKEKELGEMVDEWGIPIVETSAFELDMDDLIARLEDGERVSIPEAQYDKLIDATDDHPYGMKLASLWDSEKPGNLIAFFKGLSTEKGSS